jgi:hypothetical protein
MRKSSINFKNVNFDTWEHNHRNYIPSYAINSKEENQFYNYLNTKFYKTVNNKYGEYEKIDFDKIKKVLQENYQKSTGQKPQPKTQYFKEAVVNTDKHITKDHFDKLNSALKEKFNVRICDVAHHKDEGYINDKGEPEINYHAHIIFVNADMTTGKTIRWDKVKLRELQTVVADCLEMERGVDKRISKTKRLEHTEYKKHIIKVKELEKQISELSKELSGTQKVLVLKKQELEKVKDEKRIVVDRFNNASDTIKELQQKNNELEALFESLGLNEIKQKTQDISKIKKMLLEKLALEYNQERTELKNSGMAKQSDYSELKKDNDNKKELIQSTFKRVLTNNIDNVNNSNKKDKQIDIG